MNFPSSLNRHRHRRRRCCLSSDFGPLLVDNTTCLGGSKPTEEKETMNTIMSYSVVFLLLLLLLLPNVVVALLQPHHHWHHHHHARTGGQRFCYGNRVSSSSSSLFGKESDGAEVGGDTADALNPTTTMSTEGPVAMYFAAKQETTTSLFDEGPSSTTIEADLDDEAERIDTSELLSTTITSSSPSVPSTQHEMQDGTEDSVMEAEDVTEESVMIETEDPMEEILMEEMEGVLEDNLMEKTIDDATEGSSAMETESVTEEIILESESSLSEIETETEKSLIETADAAMESVMEETEDLTEVSVMEDITEALPTPSSSAPPPPPPESLMETAVVATTKATKKTNDDNAAAVELLESIGGAAMSATLGILSALRWGAAMALTASLPDNERSELLDRMAPKRSEKEGTEQEVMTKENEEIPTRGSVQEEIAAAVVQETRNNKAKWEKEKESLMKQMEEAANERVKNELAVQKDRLEKEKQTALLVIEAEKKEFEIQKMQLEKAVDTEKEITELESLLMKRQQQQDALSSVEEALRTRISNIELEKERISQIEAEVKKREEQQSALDAMEQDLRKRISDMEAEKERLAKLEAEIADVREKQQHEVASDDALQGSQIPYLSSKEFRALSAEEKAALKEQRDAIRPVSVQSSSDVHPVLGPIVSDLGYKRIHLVSSGKLGTLPVWNKNRIYRNDRAKFMAGEKMKSMHLGFPGIICVHEDKEGKLSILDGQHRVGMMAAIREKRNKDREALGSTYADDFMFDQVLVEVYPQSPESSDKHAEEIFMEINKAEPVKL